MQSCCSLHSEYGDGETHWPYYSEILCRLWRHLNQRLPCYHAPHGAHSQWHQYHQRCLHFVVRLVTRAQVAPGLLLHDPGVAATVSDGYWAPSKTDPTNFCPFLGLSQDFQWKINLRLYKKPSLFSSLDGVWCSNWFMVTIGEWVVHRCWCCCCGCCGCGAACSPEFVDHGVLNWLLKTNKEYFDRLKLNNLQSIYSGQLKHDKVFLAVLITVRLHSLCSHFLWLPVITIRIVSRWSERLGQGALSNRWILFTARYRIAILSSF